MATARARKSSGLPDPLIASWVGPFALPFGLSRRVVHTGSLPSAPW